MRFGWSFIIGIIPGAGDIADATLNHFLIIRKARQAEIPNWLLRRMLLNNAVAALVGLVPIAGDLVVVMFKTNSRNAALLEEFLRIRGEEFLKAESQRVQDPKVIKPGAGKEQGEKVTGKREGVSGWFGRRKSKEPVPAPGPSTAEGAPAYKGRFVENMPADDPPPRKK
ncbi:hypothetical protein A0H81_08033 [Grifola frondosa]|uniref:Uncharacterized protein n=1 Tax=Grifola frondosa TaxID=5627 RepID=A0A1C7M6R4_GRIFR|nr:hypothetical protein A0H81_08033 [Grifola frondosa]